MTEFETKSNQRIEPYGAKPRRGSCATLGGFASTRRKGITRMEWLIGFSTAVILAFVGYWLTQQQRKSEKRDEQIEAVAALRFELQSNLGWIDGILESHNYLRDEAWVTLKNKGYISYLPSPIPMKVISVYDKTHRLNEQIRVLREETQNFNAEKAEQDRTALRTEIIELIAMLDIKYPKIGRNFRG